METQPSQRLGPYEILSRIGAGGMGEVYKARDTRLDRIVAIKVLPAHLADKPGLRERFEREARIIASLNHPHICTLYDIGHQDGIDFLVMEYLEGETLAMRLMKGPLPLQQVLQYAIEIADALDKAHGKGATHRDIKPANIMLIPQTGTKLLDFGLAKLRQEATTAAAAAAAGAGAAVPLSQLPTAGKDSLTVHGTVLGTLQYMAPEQVEGKTDDIDGRTDIFAFGAVVYEMATGQKAFQGKSTAGLYAKILEHDPPPISSLQPTMPPALDCVVKRCFAKEPDERWQTARDARWALEALVAERSRPSQAKATGARSRLRWALNIIGLVMVGAVLSATLLWPGWRTAPLAPHPVIRFSIDLTASERLGLDVQPVVALSSQGTKLVYVVSRRGQTQLYIRDLDRNESRPLRGTEGGYGPFFSPDDASVGFFAVGKLKKVGLTGEAPATICDVPWAFGAAWAPDDTIVFASGPRTGLSRVSAGGGVPSILTEPDSKQGELGHRWPHMLPDGRSVLFTVWRGGGFDDAAIVVRSLVTGQQRRLAFGTSPRYLRSGHLAYMRAGVLFAAPFDSSALALRGAPTPVLENIETVASGAAHIAVSDTGSVAYVPGVANNSLVWVDRSGATRPVPLSPRFLSQPRLTRDGQQVALSVREANTDAWIYDVPRGTLSRLTSESGENETPLWSPDQRRIAYSSSRAGEPPSIFWRFADRSGKEERLATSDLNPRLSPAIHLSSWSPDGRFIAFTEFTGTQGDIYVLLLDGDRRRQAVLETPANEHDAAFSPDGRWLAYTSDESGRDEVYVTPFPGPGGRILVSVDGGAEPRWAPSGRELFYRGDDEFFAVGVDLRAGFTASPPRLLFTRWFDPDHRGYANYDVSPDGQQFLMTQSGQERKQLNVVLNWFEELKRRVPAEAN